MRSKIGSQVKFSYPERERSKTGTIMKRVVSCDDEDEKVVYWNVVDFINFEGQAEPWLRITYYRYKKPQGRWVFAGQTSISDPIDRMVEFFSEVAKEEPRFRDFIEQVEAQSRAA